MKSIGKKINKKFRHYYRMPKTWLRYTLDSEHQSSQRYIFHHIPKCAGTSGVDALTNWFIVLKDYPLGWSDEDNFPVYQELCDNPKNLSALKSYQILVGHYHLEKSFLHQRYPNWKEQGYKLFTFLRDPLELQISLYRYEISKNRITADEPIEKRMLLRHNYIANLIPCEESNYRKALQRYSFIGIVEDYQESFNRLAAWLNKPAVDLKIYNQSSHKKINLSDKFISEFKEINQLDYKIYDYAKSIFAEQKSKTLVLPN